MSQSSKQNEAKPKKWKNNNKNKFKRNSNPTRNRHHTKRNNNDNKPNDEISKSTMKDPRFKKVFTDPRFQSIPEKHKDPNKIQVDSRFASMFTDPAFRTGYRIDRYGREITNNEAYDLHKFYELDTNENENDNNTQNEGYEAELEQEDDEESEITNKKLSRTMQKQVNKFKTDQMNEIDEDDAFWNQWDDNKNEPVKPLTTQEQKLLNRKAGKMFAYDADSTSSSSESDYNYNKLTVDEVGDDSRAILDDKDDINGSEDNFVPTNRLAIVNCDWDNICAKDIYMIFRSFMPGEGSIVKVSIYPSEYGVKMMKKEQHTGPDADIWRNNKLSSDVKQMEDIANFIDANEEKNDNVDDKNSNQDNDRSHSNGDSDSELEMDDKVKELHHEMYKLEKLENTIQAIKEGRAGDVLEDEIDTIYNKQALRKYELQKLRYYYAIAEFDSVETADTLYQQLNNREYRHTCNVLNLSFVDDEFTAPYEPKDVCTEIPDNYIAASDKHTNALGSTYLELSWDKTDPNRIELCQRSFNDQQLNSMDLEAYLQDDDAITDAGFDTDYPVTEYDTDTPNKKVLIKRRARNRYTDILNEFKQMEKTVNNSDSDRYGGNMSATTDDDDGQFNINVGNILQERLKRKEAKLEDRIRETKLRIENLSSSSDEDEQTQQSGKNDNGNKEDTFYIDDEISKLNDWIDTQKRLKETIKQTNEENNLEIIKNSKKRKRNSDEEIGQGSFDDEPLCMDGDMDEEELNDPYFNSEMNDLGGPPAKRQKLDENQDKNVNLSVEEHKKKRAMLEMMMATNDDIAGSYDPENNEIDQEKLAKNLNKKLKRNWRLRWLIKKKVKEKLKQTDAFQFDEGDKRFGAIMDDPDFAIDPTNPRFKNTKVMNRLLKNTRKMRLNKWNKKNKVSDRVGSIDSERLIASLKVKNEKFVKLKDGQKIRKDITEMLKQKGLARLDK